MGIGDSMKRRITLYIKPELRIELERITKEKGLRSLQAAIEYILTKELNK